MLTGFYKVVQLHKPH